MERDEIYLIFDSYAKTHRGASMTLRELKRFLTVEQVERRKRRFAAELAASLTK